MIVDRGADASTPGTVEFKGGSFLATVETEDVGVPTNKLDETVSLVRLRSS